MQTTALKDAVYEVIQRALGTKSVYQISFSSNFSFGNVISLTLNGDSLGSFTNDGSQAKSINEIANRINSHPDVLKTLISGSVITVTSEVIGALTIGISITGGLSQPTVTITQTTYHSEIDVFYENQRTVQPPYPCVTFRFDSFRQIGRDGTTDFSDSGVASYYGPRMMTVSVSCFGGDHFGNASRVMNGFRKNSTHAILESAGASLSTILDAQDLTSLLDTYQEPRTTFDLFLNLYETFEDNVGIIESVEEIRSEMFQPETIVGPYSIEMNGIEQWIQTPIAVNPTASSFTVIVSMNYRTLAFNPVGGLADDNIAMYSQEDGGGVGRTWLGVRYNSITGLLRTNTNFNNIFRNSTHIPLPNIWEMHCVQYNHLTKVLKIFINGEFDIEFTGITPEAAYGLHRIGANKLNSPNTLNEINGFVGPCAFYERILTGEEIRDFYFDFKIPLSKSKNDFVYSMKTPGGLVLDLLNDNHGTLVGGAQWSDFKYNRDLQGPIVTNFNI